MMRSVASSRGRVRSERRLWAAAALALFFAASAAVAGTARAQLDRWQLLRPGGRAPQGLVGASSAYDPANNRMLVFAGTAWEEDHEEVHNSVWALDMTPGDETWSLLRPYGQAPYYRRRPASTYDAEGERMLIFGGYYEDQRGYYYDTWLLDFKAREGGEWIEHPSGEPHPAGRMAASLVTQHLPDAPEPVHRAILYGGYSVTDRGNTVTYDDVWAFDFREGHEGWTQIVPAGDPPKNRDGHSAIYDARNDRMIVYGGWNRERRVLTTLEDVWALDLTPGAEAWTELTPDGRPLAVAWHSAVYDACPGYERMLVFGGYNYTGDRSTSDVWALSLDTLGSEAWERVDTTGSRPTPRDSHVAQLDLIGRRMIAYSGWDGPGEWKRDTWALELLPCVEPTATETWALPTTAAPPGTGTSGTPPTDLPPGTGTASGTPSGTPSGTVAPTGTTTPTATAIPTDLEPTPTAPSATPEDCRDEFEPDNVWFEAKEIAADEQQARTFHEAGDKDFAKFAARSGEHYGLLTHSLSAAVDTALTLYGTDGVTVLATNDDDPSAAPASRIEWACPADGTYFVMAQDAASTSGGCEMRYTLELVEGPPPTGAPTPPTPASRSLAHLPIAYSAGRGPTPAATTPSGPTPGGPTPGGPTATPLPTTRVCDPGFETGHFGDCWTDGGELPRDVVDQLDDGTAPIGGAFAALLGDPSLGPGHLGETPIPVGSAWVEQSVDVPASGVPKLSFAYRIVTYDMAEEPADTVWDELSVSIDGEDIYVDGNWTSTDLGVRHEIGWRTHSIDLSRWRGQTVTLRFASWNGRSGAPGAEWYNTWSYIDNVLVTDGG